jgi:virginiamycin B lyase
MKTILILVAAVILATPMVAQPVPIDEWEVPWEASRPRDPYVAPDGIVWFCGQRTGYVASFNPDTGDFKKYDLGEGAGPHNLIVDPDGMVWYAGNRRAHIGRLNPVSGEVTKFPMPDERAGDPHTLVWAPDGSIWFTVQSGNFIGNLSTADGTVRLVRVPTERARPYGIKMDSKGRPWVVEFGSFKIATVDPETMQLTEIPLPREDARPRRIEITPDDRVWYADYAKGFLGVYDPEDSTFREWPMPSGSQARPYGMAQDHEGNIWFVETGVQPNVFIGFSPASEQFFSSTEIGSGGGSIRHMYFDAETRSVWFGADANTIGRARVDETKAM